MKTALLVAAAVALVAAAAWAISNPRRADVPYTVEVSDVAGVRCLVVSPEVAVAATGHLVMPEVVARANTMPEVTARASAVLEVAVIPRAGSEVAN